MPSSSVEPAVHQPVDLAAAHPVTFALMLAFVVLYALITVAYETKLAVKFSSFIHPWTFIYIPFLALLMPVTTAMSLVLLYKQTGELRIDWIPASVTPLAAAVFGVFGFDILFRKFVVGFGENQFELSKKIQDCLDQAVAATLKRKFLSR